MATSNSEISRMFKLFKRKVLLWHPFKCIHRGCILRKGRWYHFPEHLLPIILSLSDPDAVDNLHVNHADNLFSVSPAETEVVLVIPFIRYRRYCSPTSTVPTVFGPGSKTAIKSMERFIYLEVISILQQRFPTSTFLVLSDGVH